MKNKVLYLALIILTVCCSPNIYTEKYTQQENVIIEGVGFDSFKVGETKVKDVVRALGKGYELVKHKDYSKELVYKNLGVSFYYYPEDETNEIFGISFKSPFKGKTKNGIELGKSTIEDVAKIYGELDWSSCESCDTWSADYDGIEFYVEREKDLPHYPLNEEIHQKKKVIEIFVFTED